MRICIVEMEPSYGGGSERICLELAKGFACTDEVYLICDSPGTMLPEYERICRDVSEQQVDPFGWRTLARSLRSAVGLRRRLVEWSIDAVVCSNIHLMRTLALAVLGTRVRILYHLGLPASRPMASKRAAFKKMHVGVAPSQPTMQSWLREGWPAERIHVVPNWVNATQFRPVEDRETLRVDLGLPVEGSLICYVGRLVEEKGIGTLLRALAILSQDDHSAMLICVGTSPKGGTEPWSSIAKDLRVANRVRWIGKSAHPESYLAAADYAVVPSEWDEPFGLTVLEAMACGTPPVVTDAGVLPQLVGDDAKELVCPQRDPAALAGVLRRLGQLPSDRRSELGARLRERALKCFSFEPAFREYRRHLEAS